HLKHPWQGQLLPPHHASRRLLTPAHTTPGPRSNAAGHRAFRHVWATRGPAGEGPESAWEPHGVHQAAAADVVVRSHEHLAFGDGQRCPEIVLIGAELQERDRHAGRLATARGLEGV